MQPMTEILRIGATVATPLGLLGLIAALGYYVYSRRLKHEEKQLKALPPAERAHIADQRLSRYGIDGSNLTRDHKNQLILNEMEKRYRLARLYAFLFAVVFIICFGFASITFIYSIGTGSSFKTLPSPEHYQSSIDTDTIRDNWNKALDKLLPLLRKSQHGNGGFGSDIGNPEHFVDAWTTAQSIAGLLALNWKAQDSHPIKDALKWLSSQKKGDGWLRFHFREEPPSTEITAWVGVAYDATVRERIFSDNLPQEKLIIEELQAIHTMLSKRQGSNGAWPSYPILFPSRAEPGRSRGSYATALAMTFLIRLAESTFYETIIDQTTLRRQIDQGVRWIFSEYNSEIKGWEDWKGDGIHEGLYIIYLNVLTEAKRSGFTQIEPDRRYREARKAWLERWTRESKERDISANYYLTQRQETVDQYGKYANTFEFPVRVIWHPWSLLLATYLALDADLPQEERRAAVQIQQHLWRRLPKAVDEVTIGVTFRIAETLLVLGVIGKQNGWN
jgi:hypothetical protein